jgi:hypothetical protein
MGDIENYPEFDVFMASIDGKSKATIKSYTTQYNKLKKALGKDISESSQNKIIDIAQQQEKANSKQAIINIGIIVRRLYKLAVDKLENEREMTKTEIKSEVKEKNQNVQKDLPTLNDLDEYTDYLYKSKKWFEYIINYLLINYQTRNKDLNFTIVNLKRDTKDPERNFMWLERNKVTFIRNNYKTSGTYGTKIDVIKDEDFVAAIKKMKLKIGTDNFIPNEDNVGYFVKKSTYKEIGEGAYFKILVNANRGNLQELKKMGESRGTDLNTIATNYDTELVELD